MGEELKPAGGQKYRSLIAAAQRMARIKVAVAHPCDEVSLRGAIEAHKLACSGLRRRRRVRVLRRNR